jgi:3-oxoacyl-[acyl-carrier protein] reductase
LLLEGKTAIVTGASRGIGRAIALDLASEGAKVTVNFNASADAAEEVVEEIRKAGGEAIPVKADVGDFSASEALVKATIEAFGHVDILVNNAGTTRDKLLISMKEADWDLVLDTNLKSVFNCSRAVMRPMIRRKKGGRIINISSIVALVGQGGQTNYAASKAGILGFSRSLAREVASRQITVNVVTPGYFDTALTQVISEENVEKSKDLIPLGRWGELREVAHLVTFLASGKAAYITGQTISVDGGISM